MARALIVVDVQNDFCEGGALGVDGGNAVAEKVAELLRGRSTGHDFVLATRDCHISPGAHFSESPDFVDSWPAHCVAGTSGQQLHPALSEVHFDAVFDKGAHEAAYSGFEGTLGGTREGEQLGCWLRRHQVMHVEVVGIALDYCVKATAIDAARLGFATTVVRGLTASVHPDQDERTVADLVAAGVDVR